MKKIVSLLTLFAATSIASHAVDREITDGNFVFKVDTELGTASIERLLDNSISVLEIPRVANEGSTKYLVNAIGAGALSGCSKVKSLVIPDNITSIYADAFDGWTSLTDIEFQAGDKNLVILQLWGGPDVDMLGDAPLEKVVYSRPSSYMGIYAPFRDKETIREAFVGKEVVEVPKSLFTNCVNLSKLTLEDGIKEMDWYCFRGCTSLKEVKLPSTLTAAGDFGFEGCSGLESVTIPASLKVLPSRFFDDCTSLTSVTIPEGVQEISEFVFYGCSKLEYVSIPASVTAIGDESFRDCRALKEVRCDNPVPVELQNKTFYGLVKSNCTLSVPAASVEAYKAAPVWKDFFITAGVADITVEDPDAAEDWYTISGVKLLSEPTAPGLYIVVRKGGETSKKIVY